MGKHSCRRYRARYMCQQNKITPKKRRCFYAVKGSQLMLRIPRYQVCILGHEIDFIRNVPLSRFQILALRFALLLCS